MKLPGYAQLPTGFGAAIVALTLACAPCVATAQDDSEGVADTSASGTAQVAPADSIGGVRPVAAATTGIEARRDWSPTRAFLLGVVVPGGGQFYLRDWSGGVQAIVTDVVLFEALRRSGSTWGSIGFFIGAVHVVEGLFAAQECRVKNSGGRRNPRRETPRSPANEAFQMLERDVVRLAAHRTIGERPVTITAQFALNF